MNSNSAYHSTEEPAEYDGRLLVWTRTLIDRSGNSLQWPIWEQDIAHFFLPNANNAISLQLDFLTNCHGLIQQLLAFQFNVGIMETVAWDLSLSIFRALPTIKKFAISQSATPTIAQWHILGYEKIVGAMPGKDLARIGDHKFATENATKDNKQIFESARNKNGGVVLLSFGSVVPMHDVDAHAVAFKNIVVNLFSKQYPQMNMIIKWGERPPIGMGDQYKKMSDNIYAKAWLEQSAILGNVPKLFITHGGQNSINEAVKFGVPLLLFPFFADQFNNAEAMAARGVAKVLDIRSKTLENELAEALNEIFANYSMYKQKIEELSNKLNSIDIAKEFLGAFRQLRKSL
ncbi:hypothetical protein niasHS_005144 [Heterodera schachtii]|uniref:UDP-glucuronosyltransferase n=1 Tax=Heterodera schachtii TaxID=97005 RepID=A0ABD2JRZ9_HETSC